MSKTLIVAVREFASTVLTKGFLLGIIMMPVMIFIAIIGISVMMKNAGPRVEGTVAIIDRTGRVAARVAEKFTPEALEKEKAQTAARAAAAAEDLAAGAPLPPAQKQMATGMVADVTRAALDKTRGISIQALPPDADVEKEKAGLATVDIHARAGNAAAERPRVMLVVIPPGAVMPDPSAESAAPGGATPGAGATTDRPAPRSPYARYEVFTAPKLDFEIRQRVQRKVEESIVDARIESDPRLAGSGLSPAVLRGILDSPQSEVINVTRSGEKKGKIGELQMLIPMGFILLLFMAVMVSGQSLLTTTIEEKSSRVMEVLLSAVSPMQLMVGKIIGQMGVGLLILLLYAGMGVAGLIAMSLGDLIDLSKVVYLIVFFIIAYFTIASMMAAIGSAVSELREAQTLMTPVMMLMIIPWILWLPISRAPNSVMAQVLSFVPGANPFVMVIRLCGSEPVPAWQIPVSILVGAATAAACAWAAAKIFRIGVLMYGKPPDFRTLLKWVRMA